MAETSEERKERLRAQLAKGRETAARNRLSRAATATEGDGRAWLGTYIGGLNDWLRAIVLFDQPEPWRAPDGALLGCQFNLARQAGQDGVAIPPGLVLAMGLKKGDKVRVTLEKVE